MSKPKPKPKQPTARIYYAVTSTGVPMYWTVKIHDAKKPVTLNGTVAQALKGKPGQTIGCHLSETAKENAAQFPHPVLYVEVKKRVVTVVTKVKNGQAMEAIRYHHSLGNYVDMNDTGQTRALAASHPHLFNRQFTLLPYKKSTIHWKPAYGRKPTGVRATAAIMQRGAARRLAKAGLVTANLAM